MIQKSGGYRARFWRVFLTLSLGFTALCDEVRISEVKRLADGAVELTLSGSSEGPVTVQTSSDLRKWEDLAAVDLSRSPISFTDSDAAALPIRSYRLKTGKAIERESTALSDLGTMVNRVFPAPEGFNTVQYAPDGKLGFIVWRDKDLIFRERAPNGEWTEDIVSSGGNVFKPYLTFDFWTPREDYRFQPSATLLYDSASKPHLFKVSGKTVIHMVRTGHWVNAEVISNPLANADIAVLETAFGADDVLHVAVLSAGSPRNLSYGNNRGGNWNWNTVSTVTDPPGTYWAPPFAPRWLALAVDSQNRAHIAFRNGLDLTYDGAGHPRAYSILKYASNVSGQWQSSVVSTPRDSSGEAANGASIAIAPDDKPRIVSWYDERADTGSAQESRLYFHQQDASGNWNGTIVASKADGYIAADGNKGTGFSPYLRYDANGRAHILFMDHAGEHFDTVGQQEYAGNVRHAWWTGNSWAFETVFRQTTPLLEQSVYPAFAVSGAELAVAILQRETKWKLLPFPPLSDSKYYFRFFTKPLP